MATAKTQDTNEIKQKGYDHIVFSLDTQSQKVNQNFMIPLYFVKVVKTPSQKIIYTNFPKELISKGTLTDYLQFIVTSLSQQQILYCKQKNIDLINLDDGYKYRQPKQIRFEHCIRRYDYILNQNEGLEIKDVSDDFLLLSDLVRNSSFGALKDFKLGQGGNISDFQNIVMYKLVKEINDGNYIK